MIIREVHYWRHAVIYVDAALGMWLFKNWNLPKERLIVRLAGHVNNNRHDTN